jgi:beta-phosphoglucomutase
MIKAVLFDMDGVLIDAKDWHYEALNMALEIFGYFISRDAHLTTFDGLPTRKKLQMLSDARGLPEGLHDFLNALKQNHTMAITQQKCKPTFNHQFTMSRLKEDGKLLGVCSNSVRQTVISMMRLSNLEGYLDVVYSNEDVSAGKPDPEMYVAAMKDLGVAPDQTLILEDNDHGIEAAIASGAHLMKIGTPSDVTYQAIRARIDEICVGV